MPKSKPQIKPFQPPQERAHRFKVTIAALLPSFDRLPKGAYVSERHLDLTTVMGLPAKDQHLHEVTLLEFALNARDAHYQLSIQMEALGWTEGQNWRVTMICPEEEK